MNPNFLAALRNTSEEQALADLEAAAARIVKYARWCSLGSAKINELRRPLLALRLARRKKNNVTATHPA